MPEPAADVGDRVPLRLVPHDDEDPRLGVLGARRPDGGLQHPDDVVVGHRRIGEPPAGPLARAPTSKRPGSLTQATNRQATKRTAASPRHTRVGTTFDLVNRGPAVEQDPAAAKPPTRPPRWPPIEMPGMANVKSRLMHDQRCRCRVANGSMPRDRWRDDGGPHQAEHRARRADGERVRVEEQHAEASRRAATRRRGRRTGSRPSAGSSSVPSWHSSEHVERRGGSGRRGGTRR